MRVGDNLEEIGAVFDLNTTGDAMAFRVSTPIRVVRWGIITSTALVGAAATLALDRTTHAVDGTPSRVDAVGGKTLTLAVDASIGRVYYAEPDEGPTNEVILKPGDILHIDGLTAQGTSGSGYPFIQYHKLNWDDTGENADFDDATPTNRMVDGST